MPRHTCIVGRQPIPNGQARIRSRAFVKVALCGYCWTVRTIAAAVRRAA